MNRILAKESRDSGNYDGSEIDVGARESRRMSVTVDMDAASRGKANEVTVIIEEWTGRAWQHRYSVTSAVAAGERKKDPALRLPASRGKKVRTRLVCKQRMVCGMMWEWEA